MSILKQLFSWRKHGKENGFHWENTGFGLRFRFPVSWKKERFQEGLATYQYLVLQQLLEAGEAQQGGHDIHVDSDVVCRLDPISRQILGLPDPWPGHFELEVHSATHRPDFALSLRPLSSRGRRSFAAALEGPFLVVEGTPYLPDTVQWLALHAVAKHTALSPAERNEIANLRAVHAVQQACRRGADIDIRHFSDMPVEIPQRVGVTAMENKDGSLRLVPDFGADLSPDAVEARLGQIEGRKGGAVLRVGKQLVLLDERRLQAAHEILSSRRISAREKRQFFKTPGAYLDASLIDLDTGFSLRVHGMEIFQKAYFGQTENDSLSWFGENGQEEPGVFFLENCLPVVEDEAAFSRLRQLVEAAVANGQDVVLFGEKTILLPESPRETHQAMAKLHDSLLEKLDKADTFEKRESSGEQVGTRQITVKIDLHDEDMPENIPTEQPAIHQYMGDLFAEELLYTFHDYQEIGTRWISALMLPSLEQYRDMFCGGLLADDMGLGKTFMVLAALNIYRHLTKDRGQEKPVLAVMPVVLLENWQQEVEKVFKTSPFRDIVILQSSAQLRQFRQEGARRESVLHHGEDLPPEGQIRYSLKIGSDFGPGRLDMPGRLILTNYDTLRDYQFSLCLVDWGCVIFDEAQEIKNPNTIKSRAAKGLKADFRLAVTGTPVENSLTDFWSLYDTVKPGLLGSFQEFRRTYVTPIKQSQDGEAKNKMRLAIGKQLRQTVGPFMLRRTKEDHLSGLPCKIIHDGMEDSRYCAVMDGLQLKTYNAVISTVVAARQSGDAAQVQQTILPSLRKLQSVSLHPALLDGGEPALCDDLHMLQDILQQSAKLVLLLDILDEIRERQEKVIIFVINKSLQRFLSYALGRLYGLSISIVNGDTRSVSTQSGRGTASRIELIRRFEAHEGFNIICMSPLAAGVGLTVVGANNVIHLERHWNPAKEAQATDRVYRLGATRDVHVYIPILKHPENVSFDVNLNTLLKRKIDLKDAVIAEDCVHGEDFDTQGIFGTELHEARFQPEWLQGLDWAHFEALTALLAQQEWGGAVYLTSQTGDHGADVVVEGRHNVIIQCKTSLRPFGDSNAACQPHSACTEYAQRRSQQFDKAILAVNAPRVEDNVRSRAKSLGVILWDRPALEGLLKKHSIQYADIDRMLAEPRLAF